MVGRRDGAYINGGRLMAKVGNRQRFASTYESILYESADSYAQSRLVYLQKRHFELGIEEDTPDPADDPAAGYVGGFTAEAIDAMLEEVRADFLRWSAGFAPLVMGNQASPKASGEFARSLRRYPPEVASTVFTAAFRSDFRASMHLLDVPTLLLQSSADPAVPLEAAQWLADEIPQARLRVLSAHGHFPHVVAPAEVIRALTQFGVPA